MLVRTRERLAERPVLRIGFIRLARPLLEDALRQQHSERRAPRFDVRLLEMTSEAQARALGRDELDVAIGFDIPDLVSRADVETSIVAELRYALVLPERAWVNGQPSPRVLRTLSHVHPPRRYARANVEAAERWLMAHDIVPARALEQASATELIAYAASGHGFGFLLERWKAMASAGVVFANVPDYEATARIAVCSLRHVTTHVTALRTSLEASARAALE
jgi:DNA-binding transcriptional LysR family regulator